MGIAVVFRFVGVVMAALLALAVSTPVEAAGTSGYRMSNGACWDDAAKYHGLDPWLLYAIAKTESSFNPSAINRNKNGTYDVGLMQINSIHLPELQKYGIPASALKNACASTYIGAWILAKNFKRYGHTWEAIAAYNVGSLNTPGRRATGYKYTRKVYEAYNKLVRQNQGRRVGVIAPQQPQLYAAASPQVAVR